MKKIKYIIPIVENSEIAKDIYLLKLDGAILPLNSIHPGTFFIFKVQDNEGNDPYLRRPFSPLWVDLDKEQINFIYKIKGSGTKNLSTMSKKLDLIGPLGGRGFPYQEIQKGEKVLLVGGGSRNSTLIFCGPKN